MGYPVPTVFHVDRHYFTRSGGLLCVAFTVVEVFVFVRDCRVTEHHTQIDTFLLQSTDDFAHVEVHVPEGKPIRFPFVELLDAAHNNLTRSVSNQHFNIQATFFE
ncbi:hypothetical protein D3C87_1461590 [compost metagenome]